MNSTKTRNAAADHRVQQARASATIALEAVNAVRTLGERAAVLDQAPKPKPSDRTRPQLRLSKPDQAAIKKSVEQLQRIHAQLEADARRLEAWELGGRAL